MRPDQGAKVILRRASDPRSWLVVLATLVLLLPPGVVLGQERVIALTGSGGDAWTFEKPLEGEVPDRGCDRVLVASSRATVEAWQTDGRFGVVVPLLEGDNEVRAICRVGGIDRSVSEPQHWRVRLRDVPKAWIRIVPAQDEIVVDAGASEPAPGRSGPVGAHHWRRGRGDPRPL